MTAPEEYRGEFQRLFRSLSSTMLLKGFRIDKQLASFPIITLEIYVTSDNTEEIRQLVDTYRNMCRAANESAAHGSGSDA